MTKEYMEKMGGIFNSLACYQNNVMDKPLKIVTWNANGLAKHSQKIKTFIFSQNIDILLVSETHFTNKSYCHVPEYILYHIMHPNDKAYEEIALIIRSNIKHYEIGEFKRNTCRLLAWWCRIEVVALLSQQHMHRLNIS